MIPKRKVGNSGDGLIYSGHILGQSHAIYVGRVMVRLRTEVESVQSGIKPHHETEANQLMKNCLRT